MKKSLLFVLTFLSFTLSCNKKEPLPRVGPYTTVEDFLDEMDPEPQTFSLDMKVGGSYTTIKGTTIVVPANGLVDKNGVLVDGNVEFTIKEVFSIKDMIFSNVLPVSDGQPLKSAGAFLLQAFQGDTALEIAPFAQIWATIPAQTTDSNMQIFIEEPDEDTVNWTPIDLLPTIDSMGAFYDFPLPLGFIWYNLDILINFDPDSLVYPKFNYTEIEIPVGPVGLGYAIDTKNNNVMPIPTGNKYASSNLLKYGNYKIFIIFIIDGTLHYGYRSFDGIENLDYDIAILPITKENLEELLSTLP